MGTEQVKYEEAAEIIQCEGWQCKRCKRFWGVDEHHARWCCATDLPCECGGRILEKHYTHCGECRTKKDSAKWFELYAKAESWDGETWPLYSDTMDRMYWDYELIDEIEAQISEVSDEVRDILDLPAVSAETIIPQLRLRFCTPNEGRHFEMNEFLCDDLAEDETLEADDIDKIVNDWITARAPLSWSGNGVPVRIESVIEFYQKYK